MNVNQALLKAAMDRGLISEFNFIPEAENVILGGSGYIFQFFWDCSDSQKVYDSEFIKKCCGYLFAKGVEATISWGQTKDGKFSIFYDPKHLVDMDLHAEVPSQFVTLVQDSCVHGPDLYEIFLESCAPIAEDQTSDIDLKSVFKDLFLMCSRIGVAYALEKGFHKLPGSEKGPIYIEQIYDQDVYETAEMGLNFYQGKGVVRDLSMAFSYLTRAAEKGHIGSQYGLGMMFLRGEGTTKDEKMALHWLLNAAENGNAQAQHEVSVFYFNGVGCNRDTAKAFLWCRKAADQNIPEAIYNMGLFYFHGLNVSPDHRQAAEFIKRAAEMGHQDAIKAIKELGLS